MTDEELKAIRDRCDKATPGPWEQVLYELEATLAEVDRLRAEVKLAERVIQYVKKT